MKPIIVMADVVASRKVYGEQTQALLRDVVSKVNQHFHDQIESYFTITLGDEFQGLVQSVESAVSIMIYIEELLVSYQTMAWYDDYLKLRYVVSDGQINSEIHHDIAYEMNGLGLTAARAQLEGMKKSKQRFQISLERDRATAQFLTDFFTLYQSYVDDWRPKDFELVSLFLAPKRLEQTYIELAQMAQQHEGLSSSAKLSASGLWKREQRLRIKEYKTCRDLILTYTQQRSNNEAEYDDLDLV